MEEKKSFELQPMNKKHGHVSKHAHEYTDVPTVDQYYEKQDKPWQRVIYDIGRKGAHLYEPVRSVPSTLLILLLGLYLLLGFLTQLVEDDLVRVVSDADLAFDNAETFSEESSWRYLRQIVGDAPRVCGTPYHLQKTRDVQALVQRIANDARLPVRVDWQIHTDNYFLNQGVAPHLSFYHNASNIIAVLEGEAGFSGNETASSTLVNCHYDSVPFALGASDDALFCAVMMETLSKLSRRQTKLKHNIIFFFNGAEENGLQGAHAFLSHPWFRGVTSVVNLDSAGINGKATLFQVSDPRVLNIYKRQSRKPNAQAVGEFLFATGVIPSDTDFRVWRDYGNVHGVDVAFTKGGHVYHTRYDTLDRVKLAVQQYAGNMLMDVLTGLAESDDFGERIEPTAAVYYDYLNTFLVVYSYNVAYVVDVLVLLVAVLSVIHYVWLVGFRWSTLEELLYSILGRVLSMVGGMVVLAVLMPIMVSTTGQLRYLSQPWIVVGVFWLPWLVGAVATSHAFDLWRTRKSGMNRSIRCIQAQTATRIVLILILLVLLLIPGTATVRYLLTVPLFILSVVSAASISVVRSWRLEGWQHLLLEIALSLPSAMFVLSIALRLDALLLPIMGRTATDIPDYVVGAVNMGLAIYCAVTVSGIELLFSRRRVWMVLVGTLAACVVVMFVPMCPYQDDGPSTQRHYWFHTEIVSYDYSGQMSESTHGVFISKHDANTIDSMRAVVSERFTGISSRVDFTDDCATKVYCNLPLYRPRFANYLKDGLFLYTGPPAASSPAPRAAAARSCTGETCLLQFTVTGPPHNLLTFWPVSGTEVTAWSFFGAPTATFQQLGRPVYVVMHSMATYQDVAPVLQFNITMTVPLSLQSGPVLLTSQHAHKIQHPAEFTPEYTNLLDGVPRYFNVASFLTVRSNYEF